MDTVDYVKPADVAMAMVETGRRKLGLAPRDLLIRGMLSGAILGVATSLAFTGAVQSNLPLVGALIFPVGLISIVLLGLELVTGSFALVPLPWLNRETSASAVIVNWGWVFIGNLIGSVVYGALIAIALTNMATAAPAGVASCRSPRPRRSAIQRSASPEWLPSLSKRCCATGWFVSPSCWR
jgi:formate/nitrite transporter FocA (FNT family)